MPPLPAKAPPSPEMGGGSIELSKGEKAVMSFFDIEGAGLALEVNSFTQEEMVSHLVNHSRHPDPKVSQKAIGQLLAYLKDVATVNGRIGKAKLERSSEDAQGNRTREVVEAQGLTSRLTSSRPGPSTLDKREFIAPSVQGGGDAVPEGD